MMTSVGIISDTHNLLRPEAAKALEGSDIIIHAGDIGGLEIIEKLKSIAPVCAIRGNIDTSPWGNAFQENDVFEISDTYFYVVHDIHDMDLDPADAGFDVVISGHSHKPKIERTNGVLFINPGSAGPRRFNLPLSIAKLTINNGRIRAELIELCI